MRNTIIIFLVVSMLLAFSACAYFARTEEPAAQEMGVKLTEEEKTLLKALYPEEFIETGNLLDYQKEALEYLRAGKQYLEERYPYDGVSILSFVPASKFNQFAEIWFTVSSFPDEYLAVISKSEDGFYFADTLMCAKLNADYDEYVENVLGGAGFDVRSSTTFPNPLAGEFPADGTVEDFLEFARHLKRTTRLFIVSDDQDATAEALREAIHNAGLYGTYHVAFCDNITGFTADDLNAKWDDLQHVSFNCFDIKSHETRVIKK